MASVVVSARVAGQAAAHAHGRGAGAQKKPSGHAYCFALDEPAKQYQPIAHGLGADEPPTQ